MESLTSNSVIQGNKKSPDQGLGNAVDDISSIDYKTLRAELEYKTDLFSDLFHTTYPKSSMQPKGTKSALKRISYLLERQNPESDKLKEALNEITDLYNKLKAKNEKDSNEALKEAEKREREQNEAIKQRNLKEDARERIAKQPPRADGSNPLRPSWTYYSEKSNIWRVDENKLANELFENIIVRRVQENGKVSSHISYNAKRGQWELISTDDLKNAINDIFENPDMFEPDPESPAKYASDLEEAKVVTNVATLWLSKIQQINPQKTFDYPPEYLVHCKTFDFDLMNWRKVPFSADHYFVSGLRVDPSELGIETLTNPDSLGNITPEQAKQIEAMNDQAVDTLAQKTQSWLTQSLGDKDTERAFLERLGLSFIHNYENNFWVFMKSTGGQGKSFLHKFLENYIFQIESVSNLDLDAMVKKGSFDASELRQKDINLTSEVETKFVPNSAINALKGLSGNDRKNFPQKFLKTAPFTNFANLWFNTNHFPRFETYDDAVARRTDLFVWHTIKDFEKKFSMQDIKREVPELLVVAMYLARKCLKREPIKYDYFSAPIKLRRSRQMIDLYKDWSLTNDLVTNFIEENCVIGADYKVGYSYLYQKLKEYIKENTDKPYEADRSDLQDKLATMNVFRSSKKTCWSEYSNNKQTGKHNGVYVYEGITLKEFAPAQKEDNLFIHEQRQKGLNKKEAMYN